MLQQCIKACDDIVVSYGSHLFDGTKEDIDKVRFYSLKYPMVKFVCYPVGDEYYTGQGVRQRPQAYWHNVARWTGINALANNDWVLLIDADEIPEGEKLKEWWSEIENSALLNKSTTYKIANYWYFKDPTNRSQVLEDSVLLIHAKYLSKHNIFGDMERDYLIHESGTKLVRKIKGVNGEVMFHHFSWCRTKEGLLHKIKNWGHANEYTNPEEIVAHIFRDDNVNDVIHRYKYSKVPNIFNIDLSHVGQT